MATLDDLDRRLLSLLRQDGRAPVAVLSRELGVTRSTVTSRLERLVSSGTVVGFTVRVRDEADPLAVRAICLIEVTGRNTDAVIKVVRGWPEIRSLHTTNGGWDLVAELEVADLGAFDQVLGRIRRVDGVRNTETSLLLSSVLR